MKLFAATFAIVTACSFAIAASGLLTDSDSSERTGVERSHTSYMNVSNSDTNYEICDQYCKLVNDQLLAIHSAANVPVTYVTVNSYVSRY